MKFKMENKYIKIIVLVSLLVVTLVFFKKIFVLYENVEPLIQSPYGVVIYMVLIVLAILIAPIPTSPLVILAGITFGPWKGMIYTLISATIGAVFAFLISRFFLGEIIRKKVENNVFYKKIKGKDNKNILRIILITRLMPQVSFDLVSYVAGLTGIKVISFAIVTFIGMIPIVFLMSFFGYLIEPFLSWILGFLIIALVLYIIYLLKKRKDNKVYSKLLK